MTFKCFYFAVAGIGLIPGGYLIVDEFLTRLRRASDFKDPRPEPGVHHFITGSFERLLALALIALCIAVGDALTVLGIWLGLKLAVNWQILGTHSDKRDIRVGALTALMAGVLSLGLGAFGGWLVRWGCGLCQ